MYGPQLDITLVDWNVDGWHTITENQVGLLERLDWDVLALQELSPVSRDRLAAARLGEGVLALVLLVDRTSELNGRPLRFSSALLVRSPLRLEDPRVLTDAPSKSRLLVAAVRGGDGAFTAASFAMPAELPGTRRRPNRATTSPTGSVGAPARS